MTEQTSYTFEDCIKKCESIIDGIYQDGCQSIHLYSLKTFIYGMVDIHNKTTIELQDEVNQFREIGTIEEFKELKEKNTPMELAEHNFQDEVHHYLCPSCRNIVSCNQNYCEECGQALEN